MLRTLPRIAAKPERPRASMFATCKRGGFVLQRATKPAMELIAQNSPQDGRQTRATSGLVFAKQAVAADVAGVGSRWQRAGSGSKQARLASRRTVLRAANRSHPIMAGSRARGRCSVAHERCSLAYQLGCVDLYRYRTAELVSADAVNFYASHCTDL